MPHPGKAWRLAAQIRGRLCPRFPLDLLVRTPEEVRHRLAGGDPFLCGVMVEFRYDVAPNEGDDELDKTATLEAIQALRAWIVELMDKNHARRRNSITYGLSDKENEMIKAR